MTGIFHSQVYLLRILYFLHGYSWGFCSFSLPVYRLLCERISSHDFEQVCSRSSLVCEDIHMPILHHLHRHQMFKWFDYLKDFFLCCQEHSSSSCLLIFSRLFLIGSCSFLLITHLLTIFALSIVTSIQH